MSFERFRSLAAEGGLVPVWADCLLDTDTPVSAFAKLRRGPFAFLLESAPAGGETWARYTYLGTEPRAAWRLTDGVAEDWTADRGWHARRTPADPLGELHAATAGGAGDERERLSRVPRARRRCAVDRGDGGVARRLGCGERERGEKMQHAGVTRAFLW